MMRTRGRRLDLYEHHTLAFYRGVYQAWREYGFHPLAAWRLAGLRWRLERQRRGAHERAESDLAVGTHADAAGPRRGTPNGQAG